MKTDNDFRSRLTQLRMKKGVSEYQMSLDLRLILTIIQRMKT